MFFRRHTGQINLQDDEVLACRNSVVHTPCAFQHQISFALSPFVDRFHISRVVLMLSKHAHKREIGAMASKSKSARSEHLPTPRHITRRLSTSHNELANLTSSEESVGSSGKVDMQTRFHGELRSCEWLGDFMR